MAMASVRKDHMQHNEKDRATPLRSRVSDDRWRDRLCLFPIRSRLRDLQSIERYLAAVACFPAAPADRLAASGTWLLINMPKQSSSPAALRT